MKLDAPDMLTSDLSMVSLHMHLQMLSMTDFSGRECYCGNELDRSSGKAPEADCNTPCTGDLTQVCGGGWRLNLFSNSTLPEPAGPIATYNREGCWMDDVNDRALTGRRSYDGAMTVERCSANCVGYPYFGLEYGRRYHQSLASCR